MIVGLFNRDLKKKFKKQIHRGRLNRQLDKMLESQGIDSDEAYCIECKVFYNVVEDYDDHRH